MAQSEWLNKIRQWDNRAGQWMSRHFYLIIFQVILIVIFGLAFFICLKMINTSFVVAKNDIPDQLLLIQTYNSMLMVVLLILLSLGVLNIINHNSRIKGAIKSIEFNLSKRRADQKPDEKLSSY
jgi:hypothetical protein